MASRHLDPLPLPHQPKYRDASEAYTTALPTFLESIPLNLKFIDEVELGAP